MASRIPGEESKQVMDREESGREGDLSIMWCWALFPCSSTPVCSRTGFEIWLESIEHTVVIYGIFSLNFFQHVKRVRLVIRLAIFNKIKITSITPLRKVGADCQQLTAPRLRLLFRKEKFCPRALTAQVLLYLSRPPTASYSQRGHGMFPYKDRGNS